MILNRARRGSGQGFQYVLGLLRVIFVDLVKDIGKEKELENENDYKDLYQYDFPEGPTHSH